MYRFVATDLDGTLLNQHATITELTAQTFQALAARGVTLIVATGRHHGEAHHARSKLGTPTYLASSNGARIYGPDDTLIYASNIDPSVVRALVQTEFTAQCRMSLYHDDGCIIPLDAPEQMERKSDFAYLRRDLPALDGEGISKMLYHHDSHDYLAELGARIHARFPGKVSCTFADLYCLEIMADGVSKGSALQYLTQKLGLSLAHGIAFGDSLNDVEMLKSVGHPFLMSNANAHAVSRLPGIARAASNEASGVAQQLRQLFRIA